MEFNVGLTRDLATPTGGFSWGDISIETIAGLPWKFIDVDSENFTPESVSECEAIVFAGPGVIPGSFGQPENSPLLIARLGVGFDSINLEECTRAGVAVTITPDGSRKPVATAALALTLATTHRLGIKMAQAKSGAWKDRINPLGDGLNGKTIATIGFGNIASEFFRLLSPFDARFISYDPWKKQEDAEPFGVTLVSLEELMATADVIVVMAQLTSETHHLIDAEKLRMCKPTTMLINISRGPIVNELDLIQALHNGVIAGAGLDVFENEPLSVESPLLDMPNVIATPHNISWTHELGTGMGASAMNAVKMISQGKIPPFIVNKEVIDTPQFQSKLQRFQEK